MGLLGLQKNDQGVFDMWTVGPLGIPKWCMGGAMYGGEMEVQYSM